MPISKLQKFVNTLCSEITNAVPLWIIPYIPGKCRERNLAIAAWAISTELPIKSWVLDSVILETGKEEDQTEKLMRLRSSTKVKTLWTYSKFTLSKTLYFRFGETAMELNPSYWHTLCNTGRFSSRTLQTWHTSITKSVVQIHIWKYSTWCIRKAMISCWKCTSAD